MQKKRTTPQAPEQVLDVLAHALRERLGSPGGCLEFFDVMQAAQRYVAEEKPMLENPEAVADVMRPLFLGKPQEEFWVLCLNTKHRLISASLVTVGLVDRSQVAAREVFRRAIGENASRVILSHNHPSGDPTPSAQDIACTRDLVAAGKVVGIEVLDHVVLGERTTARAKDFLSFREEGLIGGA